MVPCNDDDFAVRQRGKPVYLSLDFGDGASVRQVAGVDQDVARGDMVRDVRVRV
jgi:hypothetical protein